MPLSEEELRLLEQMERALVAEDPKFASTLRGTKMRQQAKRHMLLGILAFVVGIAALMGGVILPQPLLGVLGFVIMLASAYFTLTTWKTRGRAAAEPSPQQPSVSGLRVVEGGKAGRTRTPKTAKSGTMMERFEERWRRRRDQNGGF